MRDQNFPWHLIERDSIKTKEDLLFLFERWMRKQNVDNQTIPELADQFLGKRLWILEGHPNHTKWANIIATHYPPAHNLHGQTWPKSAQKPQIPTRTVWPQPGPWSDRGR